MSSSAKTPNLQLDQWNETDNTNQLRADLNSDFLKIDTAEALKATIAYVNGIKPTASLAAYGWWKDPTTGLILQYGSSIATACPSGNVSTNVAVNWPMVFPTGLLYAFAFLASVSDSLNNVIVEPYQSDNTMARAIVGSAAAQNVTVAFLGIGH